MNDTPEERKDHNMRDEMKKNSLSGYVKYSALAFQMIIIIGGATWGGIKLDQTIGWRVPVFTIVLSLVSIGLSIYMVIKSLSD